MKIKENVELAPLTTLRVGGPARFFTDVKSVSELEESISFAKEKALSVFVLAGGSNIVVSDDGFAGLVIKIEMMGREVLSETDESVKIKVGAGEILDEVIDWTADNNWWGIENLSFVPGSFGAFVIQNAGCYGQEAADVVSEVEVYDKEKREVLTLTKDRCQFRYRTSIFNKEEKDRYVVLSVIATFKKGYLPNMNYGDVIGYFEERGIKEPSIEEIRKAIIEIRTEKGQDPDQVWSAGSFFSNLLLTKEEFEGLKGMIAKNFNQELADKLDEINAKFSKKGEIDPSGEVGKIKVPAGFILDRVLDLKGKLSHGGAAVSPYHALNLINTGKGTVGDIMELFKQIRIMAKEKLGISLINEPELVGFAKEELDYYFQI